MLQRRWPRDAFVVWFGGTLVVFSTWSANNDALYELTRMLVASCLFCICGYTLALARLAIVIQRSKVRHTTAESMCTVLARETGSQVRRLATETTVDDSSIVLAWEEQALAPLRVACLLGAGDAGCTHRGPVLVGFPVGEVCITAAALWGGPGLLVIPCDFAALQLLFQGDVGFEQVGLLPFGSPFNAEYGGGGGGVLAGHQVRGMV